MSVEDSMKKLLIIVVSISISLSCIANEQQRQIVVNTNQHIAMSVLLALHYCEKQQWPESITVIREFNHAKQLSLPHNINWNLLESPKVKFEVNEDIVFKTPEIDKESGNIAVSSIHSYPGCNNGNIKVNVNINIGA